MPKVLPKGRRNTGSETEISAADSALEMNLIITRHRGAVDWLRTRGITGTVIEHATGKEGRSGDKVYGILPADYMDKFLRRGLPVYFIALPDIPLDKRKGDLSEAEMNEAGACLFRVRSIELEPVGLP